MGEAAGQHQDLDRPKKPRADHGRSDEYSNERQGFRQRHGQSPPPLLAASATLASEISAIKPSAAELS
jgi:hypothetical protein